MGDCVYVFCFVFLRESDLDFREIILAIVQQNN